MNQPRNYDESELPVLSATRQPPHDDAERAVLLADLGEIAAMVRALTDVRFKLLALLPPVAGLALLAIVSPGGPLTGAGRLTRGGAAAFGLLITIGLSIYDRRNSELYRDLVERARRAETELGIDTGAFRGRRRHRGLVSHGAALGLVYGTVLGAWVVAGLAVLLGWIDTAAR